MAFLYSVIFFSYEDVCLSIFFEEEKLINTNLVTFMFQVFDF